MENKVVWAAALNALTDYGYDSAPSKCQAWQRQVVQVVYGKKFDAAFYHGDAIGSYHAWKEYFPELCKAKSSVPGDLLYWINGHGPHGHTGIRVPGNMLAENSFVHNDPRFGSRGLRKLSELGKPDLIVRLPAK